MLKLSQINTLSQYEKIFFKNNLFQKSPSPNHILSCVGQYFGVYFIYWGHSTTNNLISQRMGEK